MLAKRLKEFVTNTLDLEFENIYHLVDSSTVLGYLHKQDTRLKPFEGVRVSEIQAAGQVIQGRLHNWSWVDGLNNPADWATKPRLVSELKEGGFWQSGPDFLKRDFSEWPIKLDFRTDKLEGELMPKVVNSVFIVFDESGCVLNDLLERLSSAKKLFRIVAKVLTCK